MALADSGQRLVRVLSTGCCLEPCREPGIGWLDHNVVAFDMGLLCQAWQGLILGASSHLVCNAQLEGAQLQRNDARVSVTVLTGVGDSPQTTPHHHISGSGDTSARIDIAHHQKISLGLEMVA
jgi:hypothetical protein